MLINFSLVLPCFNEEKNIHFLYKEFQKIYCSDFKSELIFVNNGSVDNTSLEIEKVLNLNKKKQNNIIIKKLDLKINMGYGGGIIAGLNIAKGEYIGWTHADLQSPLDDFIKLYELIKNKKNIFGKGKRINNRGFDGIISRFHEKLASVILGFDMKEINAQPKIFSRDVTQYFTNMPKKWTTLDTYTYFTCLKKNVEIIELEVIFKKRIYGESKWKNNIKNFVSHLIFNLIYLIKLKFYN
jgi:glycosyltransferase involved in cell wall biosynthesis